MDDLPYAFRSAFHPPVAALVITASLALGIGANTPVFSFVDAVQFKPLPFHDEATLVDVHEWSATELCSGCAVGTSYPGFLDWQSRATSFSQLGAYLENRVVVSVGDPERVGSALVSAQLFPMLGVHPVLGRHFTASEDVKGAAPVALISDALWKRRFGGDPSISNASTQDPQSGLKDGANASGGRGGRRALHALVVAQLALSLVLLAGAGLLIKTVVRTFEFDPGYDPSTVVVGDVSLAGRQYEGPERVRAFALEVVEQLQRIEGVRASVSRTVFFAGFGGSRRTVDVEGVDVAPAGASPSFYAAVTPGYFATHNVPLAEGRTFLFAGR